MTSPNDQEVSIKPGTGILSVLAHLNYQPWFALAEFVDNALQSYLANREALEQVEGKDFRLRIEIRISAADQENQISVRDNAAGISIKDFPRAFRAAEIPADNTGLSEFGMGMKSAAFWFSRAWQVRTKALGEDVERTVCFDLQKIRDERLENIPIQHSPRPRDEHYTEVLLTDIRKVPVKKTLGKIKEHLSTIYRCFLREGLLELFVNDERLQYEEPEISFLPFYKEPEGTPLMWRKEISFELGEGMRVSGFAAIRKTGSRSKNGFALFRRNRLVQGSGDEGYRPRFIFGDTNSHQYPRLFGELHLEGFQVSHTKDGVKWDGDEEAFVDLLKAELSREDMPLYQQASGYRRRTGFDVVEAAEEAINRITDELERRVEPVLAEMASAEASASLTPVLPEPHIAARGREFDVRVETEKWKVTIETCLDGGQSDWLEISENVEDIQNRILKLRVSLAHPFMERFAPSLDEVEPVFRIAAAIGLAETMLRMAGERRPSQMRKNVNKLLRLALAEG